MSGIYLSHIYTKERLLKRENIFYLLLACFQINTGYHMIVRKFFEFQLYRNPGYLAALILYALTQILFILACIITK